MGILLESGIKACVIVSGSEFFKVVSERTDQKNEGRVSMTKVAGESLKIEVGDLPRVFVATATVGPGQEMRTVVLEENATSEKWFRALSQSAGAQVKAGWPDKKHAQAQV